MFNKNNGTKKKEIINEQTQCDENSRWIFQTNNKLFVTVHPKNVCKLEFGDHLWLPFLNQSPSDVLAFAVTHFQIYRIQVKN